MKRSLFLLFFISILLVTADFVSALETSYPPVFGMTINSQSDFPAYAKYFFNIGIALAGFLAVLVVAFGGVYYLISSIKGSFRDEAKDWIKAGILGLFLVMASYVIAYTINPELVIFKLDKLLPISFNGFFNPPQGSSNAVVYNEIPIGLLTENALTMKADCFDFNSDGDPLPKIPSQKELEELNKQGVQVPKGFALPTYKNHDIVDCFLKLVSASEKKAKIAKELSNEIVKLMNQCSCAGKCESTKECKKQGGACSYKEADCIGPGGQKNRDCCPAGVRNKIEHGPVVAGGSSQTTCGECGVTQKTYKGLDEFRTTLSSVSGLIERQGMINVSGQGKKNWNSLNLIEQMMYLKEKLEQMKIFVDSNLTKLQGAKSALNNCYLAKSYVDFLKIVEQTKKEDKEIKIEKTFTDSSGDKVDVSKYCAGFNYAYSANFKLCSDACPDSTPEVLACYEGCVCKDKNDATCLKNQTKCIKDCYNNRSCAYAYGYNGTFQKCLSDRKSSNACRDSCNKYSSCSLEYVVCQKLCSNDSTCLFSGDNQERCLINAPSFQECAEREVYSSQQNMMSNIKNCINNAYACEYGSNQNAGFAECVKPVYYQSGDYSASYLYQNQQDQKCPDIYKKDPANNNAACIDLNLETQKCPSSSDCPKCPCDYVSMDIVAKLKVNTGSGGDTPGGDECSPGCGTYVPMTDPACKGCGNSSSSGSSSGSGSGSGGGSGTSCVEIKNKITAYRIVGPECTDYSFNDDPLTFYCQQNWQNSEEAKILSQTKEPIGDKMRAPKNSEVPVGNTVDDTEKWVIGFKDAIGYMGQNLQNTISHLKGIGKMIDNPSNPYCTCESKYNTGKPICKSECKKETIQGTNTFKCTFIPCKGNPCQQIKDYLLDVSYFHQEIATDMVNFYSYAIEEGRSDIFKELTYSRQKINDCSLTQKTYGKETNLFSCERIQDEMIPPIGKDNTNIIVINKKPIKAYCYGQDIGEVLKIGLLTDNWFCAELWKKE